MLSADRIVQATTAIGAIAAIMASVWNTYQCPVDTVTTHIECAMLPKDRAAGNPCPVPFGPLGSRTLRVHRRAVQPGPLSTPQGLPRLSAAPTGLWRTRRMQETAQFPHRWSPDGGAGRLREHFRNRS